ncbi:MAG: SDR family oxidoreductase [Planctomycetota bacterium]
MPDPNQKVALVTGAGSGVGRDTALLLADAGYAVVLASRTAAHLDETAAYVKEEGDPDATTLAVPTNVTDPAAVNTLIEKTLEAFGRVDALANCAGSAPLQPIERITDEVVDDALAVNLKGVIYTTRAVWPHFKKQKSGAVCSVSSMAAIDPFRGFNVYAAAKAGVNLFMKAAADEGSKFNVIAAAVAPGAIETQMLRQNFSEKAIPPANTLDPLVVAGVIRDVLTGRRQIQPGETIPLPSPH